MIHGVYANKPSFHSIEFTAGLNVVLAERTDTSTQKDTRNGLGKSTLIDIIDFCLASKAKRGKGLCIEQLNEWIFTLDITLAGSRVRVSRSVATPNRIVIDGNTDGWIEQPDRDSKTGERILNWERWKTNLGWSLFGLPRTYDSLKYLPTFRSLVSYFVRQGLDAYTNPFHQSRQQLPWDVQVNVGYLLGLNWENASRWQEIKDQDKGIKAIVNAIRSGAMEGFVGSIGDLEAQRVQLEEQIVRDRVGLDNFKVHPQYEDIQKRADRLTADIHELVNDNVTDRRKLTLYNDSIQAETPPSENLLEKLYQEVGLVFSASALRSLKNAKDFHRQIIANRKSFLETEVKRLNERISSRDQEIVQRTEERASLLAILRDHGALQEMTRLQEAHVAMKGRLDRLKTRISEAKDLSNKKRQIKIAMAELSSVAARDHEERREVWSTAVRLFNENSQALYESPGRLVIDIADTGFKFDVDIERSGSEGIGKMKIFCFDLMLLQSTRGKPNAIDFLIHDSTLYDGVDSRQRALALERAHHISTAIGAQYICTMNSDDIPMADFSKGFDFSHHVRRTLTDRDPSGSLLGFHFERPKS